MRLTQTNFEDPPAWVADAVFYQIFPDRFASSARVPKPGALEPWDAPPTHHGYKGGDLLGIVEHLDYLSDLGINALYLTPIFASASNHRYHTYDYYRVDPLLGGDDALRELLDAAHARGMRVVLDGVFNHSGRGFWPFHHVLENGAQSPYADWFYLDDEVRAGRRSLRAYPGRRERQPLGYEAWWGLPALPKLNTNNPHLREHLLGAVEHWLRFGIDGWRLDVAEEIDAGFWREFRHRVRAVNPDAYIVAEIWREKPEWLTGDTFDALMNYPLTEALLSFVAARQLDMDVVHSQHEYRQFVRPINGHEFGSRLEHLLTAYRPHNVSAQLNLLGSHDTARFRTVAGGDIASLQLALLAVMTLPGAPCIYYGDEVGMEGRHDPDCRRAFPWDESRWDTDLLGFVRAAATLRHARPVLRHGSFKLLAATDEAVAYARLDDTDAVIVVLNSGDGSLEMTLTADELRGRTFEPVGLAGTAGASVSSDELGVKLVVGGRSGAVAAST